MFHISVKIHYVTHLIYCIPLNLTKPHMVQWALSHLQSTEVARTAPNANVTEGGKKCIRSKIEILMCLQATEQNGLYIISEWATDLSSAAVFSFSTVLPISICFLCIDWNLYCTMSSRDHSVHRLYINTLDVHWTVCVWIYT